MLVLGMATGGFYAINALGFVVVFRSSGIINFAGVASAMAGGYLEWQLADQWGAPKVVAVLGAMLVAAVVSVLVYFLAIRPLSGASSLTKVIATLAVLVSLQELILIVFGGVSKIPSAILPTGSIHLGSVGVGEDSLLILATTGLLTGALWAFYRHSRFGLATSALSEAPRSLAALGWNTGHLRAANWAIGGALAGLAGAGLGPILQLTPGVFTSLLVPTLAGALLGGLRSFPLTFAGGLLVGAAQAEATRYLRWAGSGDAIPFLLILLVLMVRGRSLPLRNFVHERLPRVGSGEISVPRLIAVISLVSVAAVVVSQDWVIGATITVMTATVLLSQMVITGYAGQLSVAQLTLAGVGGLVAAQVSASYGVPFLVSILAGMGAVIPVSILVGLPSLRARGASLAIATLGFAVAINAVVLNNSKYTGGFSGLAIPPQSIFGLDIDSTLHPRRYFYVCLGVFTLLALAVANLRRGRTGRRLVAVRNNERAAAALGINVTGTKLFAFTFAGVIASAGGVLLTFNQSDPQFTGFDPVSGLTDLIAVVLGGIGYVGGAIIGGLAGQDGLPNAILNPFVAHLSWWSSLIALLTGVLLVVQLIANPNGIADYIVHGAPRRRRRSALADITGPSGDVSGSTGQPDADPSTGPARGLRLSRPVFSPAHRRAVRSRRRRIRVAEELAGVGVFQPRRRGSRLVVRDVRVSFGVVNAVDGVSIDVEPGRVLAIIGPNGAGKTTLMDAITGFVPMSGTVELDGRQIEHQSVHKRARAGIARSFQSLELLEDMTVLDNLRCAADPQDTASLFLDLLHPKRGTITPATATAIEAFGLRDKLDKLPTEIGYGDRRLLAIARAVAGNPSILLLDEPAAGLSEHERMEVARVITLMATDWNMAILLIEHDVELVRQVSDSVLALDFGRAVATGTAEEVLARPEVVSAYLGTEPPPLGATDAIATDAIEAGVAAGGSQIARSPQ